MDCKSRELKLVLCVLAEATRRKFVKLLVELATSGQLDSDLPHFNIELVRCANQQEALDYLRRKGSEKTAADFVLMSDALADSVYSVSATESWTPSQWAKEAYDAVQANLFSIAIMDSPRRVRDVDRTIGRHVGLRQLLDVLRLAADKLSYIARPEKQAPTVSLEVRAIRKQTELMEYFKLRHRIYRIMGYLDDEAENAPSKMEINWCDTISLHFGAFAVRRDGREELAGTARVVIGSATGVQKYAGLLAQYKEWTARLASQDPVLRNNLANRVLELELPIFHSQELAEVFRQTVVRNECCGELSRVIVAEDYRGTGLSGHLVKFALAEAARAGVNRMFLECLDNHEELYRKLGFRRLPGTRGTVLGVNRTMIAMELPTAVPGPCGAESPGAEEVTHA